uniref:copper-containing nitrite reductase n=1 Tax=Pararhizobium sp. IMCC3301 TaxID=3067904 RepID=UPI002740F8C2|nr:copper-containing nitrite reductase [Pararhizobium sp. IMCC3301]
MITRRTALMGAAFAAAAPSLVATQVAASSESMTPVGANVDLNNMPRRKVKLVAPPFVHEHEQVATLPPSIVEFEMTIVEKEMEIDQDGTMMQAMTFEGSVPGPLMVVHEGDYVELTLINPEESSLQHNIDFHAATGGLGGGALTLVNPGELTVLRFKATRPGTFVYHCAPGGPMIPWHVVSGMSGAIMILPRDGLKDDKNQAVRYDKVFYIGENDFYVPKDTDGDYLRFEDLGSSYADTLEVMNGLVPSHVVFNGKAGSLTNDNALTATVGETVLFVHSQANRDTRPHLIGGHGDIVWETGSFNTPPARDLETWFIRGGSAGAAMYKFRQPGVYAYVNHNLIEAVNLGATAHVVVEGEWDNDLMAQVQAPTAYGQAYTGRKALP